MQTKQQLGIWDTLYSDTVEQSVELDYMLPDYYPSIFKILRGSMQPVIQSHRVAGSKLTIEGVATLKILYLNQEDGGMRLVEQSQPFVKTVDLKQDATAGKARLWARCSYFHARAVSGQRLDLRGAISIKICVSRPSQIDLLESDDTLQLFTAQHLLCDRQNTVQKEISISEQVQIGQGNPAIKEILHCQAIAQIEQAKPLDGKVVCKGQVTLRAMYLPIDDQSPAHIEQTFPFSQIVDFMDLLESDELYCHAKVMRCNLDLQLEEDGECHAFTAKLDLKISCSMASNHTVTLVEDGYSIQYEAEQTCQAIPVKRLLGQVSETPIIKETVPLRGEISAIHQVCAEVQHSSYELRDDALWLCGNLVMTVVAIDLEGMCCCLEQSIAFECLLTQSSETAGIAFEWEEQILSTDYQILSASELAVQIKMEVGGLLYQCAKIQAVSALEVKPDCQKSKPTRTALQLYFADQDEAIWSIAKRYNTSMQAIVTENQLQGKQVCDRQMLLIPLVER